MKAIPFSYSGDLDRQQILADLVIKGSTSPKIRKLATQIVRHCPSYDELCEIQSIYNFVRDNIRYVEDPKWVDSYHSAERILELGSADCDDFVVITGSLLGAIGFPVGAKIVAKKSDMPFHHIYPIVITPKRCPFEITKNKVIIPSKCKIYPLDPSVKSLPCCKEVPHAKEQLFIYLPKFLVL